MIFKIIFIDKSGQRRYVLIEADDSVQAVRRFDFLYQYSWITNVKQYIEDV